MTKLIDPIPDFVKTDIKILNSKLDKIPSKTDDSLLIATWNIRAFGNLTSKWKAEKGDSPQRDLQSLLGIINIIKRFDIIAIQEVKDNIKCLRETIKYLGNDWSFLMTDTTKGDAGNGERLAFLFNNKKVKLSGLACEIVVPKEQLENNINANSLDKQFARTPYAVGFKVKNHTFILLTLHVLYGDNSKDRVPELKAIANWMYTWAKKLKRWNQSLIILGDFNIDKKGDEAHKAFTSKNLFIPKDIEILPSTIFKKVKHYDQIGWFKNSSNKSQITLNYVKGGIFDFRDCILTNRDISLNKLSFRISDHLPLWCKFKI